MELSHIDATVELLRAENGYVTQTSTANCRCWPPLRATP